jgi:hypothetical protein
VRMLGIGSIDDYSPSFQKIMSKAVEKIYKNRAVSKMVASSMEQPSSFRAVIPQKATNTYRFFS